MRAFGIRAAIYLATLLVLWLALSMVAGVVADRLNHKSEAQASVGQSHAGPQLVAGPTLLLTTLEAWAETETVGEGNDRRLERTEKTAAARHIVLPEQLRVVGDVQIERKKRGIFPVNTYVATVTLAGSWRVPDAAALPREHAGRLTLNGAAQALVGVGEARGLRAVALTVDGRALEIAADTERAGGLAGAIAALDIATLAGREVPFEAKVQLVGIESFAVLPLGKQNTVRITSNWPNPSYEGASLPTEKTGGDAGFDASWQVTSLASEARPAWARALLAGDTATKPPANAARFEIQSHALAVRMIDRPDIYTFTDRATKYGILFIALTLAGYALFDMFRQARMHPVQVLLVGAALVLFFLLLLSLSEQIGFGLAYLAASLACIGLIGYYSGHVLGGFMRSLPLTASLAALYGTLYLLLHSEDNALLLGTVLLFTLLAALMVATRKVDWYALLERARASAME
jgi:inner membrane protein